YRFKCEVDAEGYPTYFEYDPLNSKSLSKVTEPEGRISYYAYVTTTETRKTDLGRPGAYFKYALSSATGQMAMVTAEIDPLLNSTYYVYDTSLDRINQKVAPNGSRTYFEYVGGTGADQYALARQVSEFNRAATYYGYNAGKYDMTKLVGPRHTGVFPVASYYTYDAFRNRTSMIDPLGRL